MWVVLAVATAWLVEVGGLAEFEPRPETIPRFRSGVAGGRRVHRVFRVGLGRIPAGRLAGEVVTGRLVPEPGPEPQPYAQRAEHEFRDKKT
jgi:hypothetical protein